jgi:hypothetical protein
VVGRWNSEDDLRARAHKLRADLGLDGLLLTRSEEGMTLFDAQGELTVKAQAREVFDVTGAGDTVIATLATMVAAGLSLREAMPDRQPRRRHRGGQVRHRHRFLRGVVRMTRVVVTGAAGFIGSNIVKGLNARGITTSSRSTT